MFTQNDGQVGLETASGKAAHDTLNFGPGRVAFLGVHLEEAKLVTV